MSITKTSHLRESSTANRLSIAMFALAHLAAVTAFFVPPKSGLVMLALGSYLVRMWAITTGYHRYFSHRSFRTSRTFQFVMAWLGAAAVQNGPLWWASWHRVHHKHSDTPEDVHSPVQSGFWHAQLGWYFDGSHIQADLSNVRDLSRFPELRFIERNAWLPPLTFALACLALAGVGGLVWGFILPTLTVLHVVGFVNSIGHTWGSRRYATQDQSRNNAWLAVLTLGDGWHNNHHHCMYSARQGFRWWEFDPNYYILRALAWLGVVWDVRTPLPTHGA